MNDDSVSAEPGNANKTEEKDGPTKEERPLNGRKLENWEEMQMLAKMEPITTNSEIFLDCIENQLGPFGEMVARHAYELGMANMFHMAWICLGSLGCDCLYDFIDRVNEGLLGEDYRGHHVDKTDPPNSNKVYIGQKRAIQEFLADEEDDDMGFHGRR